MQLFKIQNKGIRILGDEVSKRNSIAAFFDIYTQSTETSFGKSSQLSSRFTEQHFTSLHSLYPDVDISAVIGLIEDAEKRFDFFLTDDYFITLLTHLIICVTRLKSGNPTEDSLLKSDDYPQVRDISEFIAEKMRKVFDISFPRTEVAYICLHLMSYYIRDAMEDIKHNVNSGENLEALTISVIELVQGIVGGLFLTDKVLYFGILCHLKSSVYRIKNRIHMNLLLNENQVSLDPAIFDAVKQTEYLYKDFCGDSFILPDGEIEALTVYFMLSRERFEQKAKAVLLNSTGVVSGVLLKRFLTEELDVLDIVDVVFFPFQLDLVPENRYDFVISMGNLESCSKPTVCLQNAQKHEYKDILADFIDKIR
jgi:activator of the mannose operon (transcriptional antiterminator)